MTIGKGCVVKTMGAAEHSPRDVRMRGFAARHVVADAWEWIDRHAERLEAETASLTNLHGRVLAEDVFAPLNVPAFDRAAMDGYAVWASETEGAGDYSPLLLSIVGQSLPGKPFEGTLASGSAVRIMTGAPLPAGADAVVPAEYATETNQQVELTASVSPGKHVGRVGEDIAEGQKVFSTGRRLRPQDVGLLASLGMPEAQVVRRPSVRIVVTGNELVPPGQPRGLHQIYEANSSMLLGLVARDGGVLESVIHCPDQKETIREALTRPGADVVLVSGGSSVGAEDHAPMILAEEGSLDLHGLAMRPSSPAGMGRIGNMLVFLLPGNPVSCLCAYDFFAGRAIRKLAGRNPDWPHRTVRLPLSRKLVSAVGRLDYCRVMIEQDRVEPLALSGASILSSTTRANGFVIVPEDLEGYAPGETVTVYLYD
jgi:molybdopterin molybdotransferase